jgi:hypothetical protein
LADRRCGPGKRAASSAHTINGNRWRVLSLDVKNGRIAAEQLADQAKVRAVGGCRQDCWRAITVGWCG